MADPATYAGQMCKGTVKSYSPSKGYGFITGEELEGDIFFCHKSLDKKVVHATHDTDFYLTGQEVSFTVEISEEGKPTAIDIEVHAEIPVKGDWKGGWGKGKGKGKKGKGKDYWESYGDWGHSQKWADDYSSKGYGGGKGYGKSDGGKGKGKGKAKGGKGKGPYW